MHRRPFLKSLLLAPLALLGWKPKPHVANFYPWGYPRLEKPWEFRRHSPRKEKPVVAIVFPRGGIQRSKEFDAHA